MEKKLNLLGIRKKVILYHTKSLVGITYTVMRPITEEDEKISLPRNHGKVLSAAEW